MFNIDDLLSTFFSNIKAGIKGLKWIDLILLPFIFLASFAILLLINLWLSTTILKSLAAGYHIIFMVPYCLIVLYVKGRFSNKADSKYSYKLNLAGIIDRKGNTPKFLKEIRYSFNIYNWFYVFGEHDTDTMTAHSILGVNNKCSLLSRFSPSKVQYINFEKVKVSLVKSKELPISKKTKKELYKQLKHRFYANTQRTYFFISSVPLDRWVKSKAELENVFNTNIISIEYQKNNKKIIVLKCKDILSEEKVIYKDKAYSLQDRYTDILYRLGLNIKSVEVIELKTVTKICFDSEDSSKTIEGVLHEFKGRMRIKDRVCVIPGELTDYEICIYKKTDKIYFKDIFFNHVGLIKSMYLPILLGICQDGKVIIKDLCKDMYHVIVAGTTGGGKSTILHSLICSLLLAKKNVTLVLLDPKKVELKDYKGVDNVVYANNETDINNILSEVVKEMDARNDKILEISFCKNLETYNARTGENLPYIVVVIEEIADLITKSSEDDVTEFNKNLKRLAQLGRSVGIRLVLSTQKPNADTLNTYIKSNCLTRFGFMTSNASESRVIIDNDKCKSITEMGAFIFQNRGVDTYVKGAYLSDIDLNDIIKEVTNGQ